MTRRRGFTLIELMMVAAIIGLLARIAIPRVSDAVRRARATRVIGDFQAIRIAAFDYHAASGEWPPDYGAGTIPPELVGSLPDGFSFNRDGYTLDWENWSLPGGTPTQPSTGILLGISVTVDDPQIGEAVIRMLGDGAGVRYAMGNTYTFMIVAIGTAL